MFRICWLLQSLCWGGCKCMIFQRRRLGAIPHMSPLQACIDMQMSSTRQSIPTFCIFQCLWRWSIQELKTCVRRALTLLPSSSCDSWLHILQSCVVQPSERFTPIMISWEGRRGFLRCATKSPNANSSDLTFCRKFKPFKSSERYKTHT
jgi:hypothetical protein